MQIFWWVERLQKTVFCSRDQCLSSSIYVGRNRVSKAGVYYCKGTTWYGDFSNCPYGLCITYNCKQLFNRGSGVLMRQDLSGGNAERTAAVTVHRALGCPGGTALHSTVFFMALVLCPTTRDMSCKQHLHGKFTLVLSQTAEHPE